MIQYLAHRGPVEGTEQLGTCFRGAIRFVFFGCGDSRAQQVNIDSGPIEGKADGDVRIFLGIPYAAPPVGDLRWKAPAPAMKWTDPRKTTEFGSHCMQGKLMDLEWRDPGPSEDCLTLNVWTSAKSADAKHPVMVWIHGGSFNQVATKYGKQPAYRYRFDLAPPATMKSPAAMGAYHSAELEYVFGTLDVTKSRPWRKEDRELSEQMQKYWTNFARSGDPNGSGLLQWPKYQGENGWQVLYLSEEPKVQKDDMRDRYVFLNSVWIK